MGVVIPEGYGQAIVSFDCEGAPKTIVSTFGVFSNTIDEEDWPETVADALASSLLTLPAAMGDEWVVLDVEVIFMTSTGPITYSHAVNTAGTVASVESLPVNCALLVRKNTSRGGRRGRGRMFWPLLSIGEANVTPGGIIGTGQVTDQQAKWDAFLADLATAGMSMYLFHEDPIIPPDVVDSLTVQGRIATQRTRMRS